MAYERFDTEAAWRQAIVQVVSLAQREIRVLDRDLRRQQLDAPAATAALEAFLAADRTRKLAIAVHDPQALQLSLPRLLVLFQRYEHAVTVRQIPEAYRHLADCHVLVDAHHSARRFHADHARGALIMEDGQEVSPWWRRFDELWEQCHPVSLGSITGL